MRHRGPSREERFADVTGSKPETMSYAESAESVAMDDTFDAVVELRIRAHLKEAGVSRSEEQR